MPFRGMLYRASSLPRANPRYVYNRLGAVFPSVSRFGAIFRCERPRGAIPEVSRPCTTLPAPGAKEHERGRESEGNRLSEIFRALTSHRHENDNELRRTIGPSGEENNAGRGIGYIERGSRSTLPLCLFVWTVIRCTILR